MKLFVEGVGKEIALDRSHKFQPGCATAATVAAGGGSTVVPPRVV